MKCLGSWGRRAAHGVLAVVVFLATACGSSSTEPPPAAVKLAFIVQPTGVGAGAAIAPEVRVAVQDAAGNTVTTSTVQVTLSLADNPSGGTLSGILTANAVNGVAVFVNVRIDKPASGYTLLATSTGLAQATSQPFAVLPGAAVRVRFHVQPADVQARRPIQPQVEVRFFDAAGNFVPTASGTVSLTIVANPSGATLAGAIAEAVDGSAVFPDLNVDRLGTGFTLGAAVSQLVGETSSAFNVWAPFTDITTGGGILEAGHTCALTPDGDVYCWGANQSGQLGIGSQAATVTTPFAVAGGLTWSAISAGRTNTCGIAAGGAMYCWGSNEVGQLGTGAALGSTQRTPAAVGGSLSFTSVSVGDAYSCGVTTGGAGYCWGGNGYSQLGDGTNFDRELPELVAGGLSFQSISAHSWHTCGVTTDGAGYCWGSNTDGQLGDGDAGGTWQTPRPVAGGYIFASIRIGMAHSCGITSSDAAYCWGRNDWGQLGNGEMSDADGPVPVAGGLTLSSLSAGTLQTCAVTTSGPTWCWGRNAFGQLGSGSDVPSVHRNPVTVSGGHTFTVVSSAADHTCGLTDANAAYCWGRNHYGQLGDGSTSVRLTPARVSH